MRSCRDTAEAESDEQISVACAAHQMDETDVKEYQPQHREGETLGVQAPASIWVGSDDKETISYCPPGRPAADGGTVFAPAWLLKFVEAFPRHRKCDPNRHRSCATAREP